MSSYATVSEGNTYFMSRMFNDAWTYSSTAQKTTALAHAKTIIDQLSFVDGVFDTITPLPVKHAEMEIAFAMLDGVNPEMEQKLLQVDATKAGSVSTNYSTNRSAAAIHGVPSATAWLMLQPYLRDGQTVRVSRTD